MNEPFWKTYGVAVLASALGAGLTLALRRLVDPALFTLLFAAVMVSAWRGGRGPGLLATALCALSGGFFFLTSATTAHTAPSGIAFRLALFVAVCALIVSLTEQLRSARRQAGQLPEERAARAEAEALRRRSEEALATLDAFFGSAPVGVGLFDRDLRCVRMNEHLAAVGGADGPPGLRPVPEALPHLAPAVAPLLKSVLEADRPLLDQEIHSEATPVQGRCWLASVFPVQAGTGAIGVGLIVREITELKRIEQERLVLLEEQGRQRDLLHALIDNAPVGIALFDTRLRCRQANAFCAILMERPAEALTGQPLEVALVDVFGADAAREIRAAVARTLRTGQGFDAHAWALPNADRLHGITSVDWRVRRMNGAGGKALGVLLTVTDVTAHRKQKRALRLQAEVSAALAASLDLPSTLMQVARLVVPLLADVCIIDLREEDGVIRRVAVAHGDPAQETKANALLRFPPRPDASEGVAEALRTRTSCAYPALDDALLGRLARNKAHLDLLKEMDVRSARMVPLTAGDRSLGAISLLRVRSTPVMNDAEAALAEDLARRVALFLDNVRLYHAQRDIAQTLQRSLLPPVLPRIAGLDLAACYHPLGEGVDAGGDFYDLFERGGGEWAVVIGDATGKGSSAAAITALARYTVRAAAMQVPAPSRILSLLNDAMWRQIGPESFCTIAYLNLAPHEGGFSITFASGGHPPPLVVRRSGGAEYLGETGMLIGSFPDLPIVDQRAALHPGDTLILYTDGVTEAARDGELFGEERLAACARSCAGQTARQTVDCLQAEVMAFQSGRPVDEIAILVLRVHEETPH